MLNVGVAMSQDLEFEHFRRLMGESACLPEDDPQRQRVVREVLARGPAAEQQWLALLRDDERLRLALRRVDPPADLEQRLLAIPDQAPVPTAGWRRRLGLVAMGLAAAVVVGLVLWQVVVISPGGQAGRVPDPVITDAKQRFIALAVRLHEQAPPLSVETSQPGRIETELAGYLPAPIQVPSLGEEYVLVGAVATTLNGRRVVVTRWRHEDQDCSLYQFCPGEFDLPMGMPSEEFVTSIDSDGKHQYRIKLWSHKHCAYVLMGRCEDTNSPTLESTPNDPV